MVASLLLAVASPARAQSDAGREAEMFGAPAAPPPAESPAASPTGPTGPDSASAPPAGAALPSADPRDDALFGGAASDPAAADARDDAVFGADPTPAVTAAPTTDTAADYSGALGELELLADRLDLGGLAYFRIDASGNEGTVLKTVPLSAPALIDLYLDARPTDRIRAYVKGRLKYDFTVGAGDTDAFGNPRQSTAVLLDQLWLKFDVLQTVYVTLGRQAVRWGSSRVWNPTDFLNQVTRDPLTVFDERLGVGLLRLHIPVESLGWNFYAVADAEGASALRDVGGALRAELLFGEAELALSGAKKRNGPWQLGADISMAVWDFDVRLESALFHNYPQPRYTYDPIEFPAGAPAEWRPNLTPEAEGEWVVDPLGLAPGSISRDGRWLLQLVAGADITIKYSDEDSLIVGAEYFYNQAGYERRRIYPALLFNNAYRPLYAGVHYAAVYMLLQAPGSFNDTTFTFNTIGNLSDRSFLSRLDYSVRVLTRLTFNVYGSVHYGRYGELRLGFRVPGVDADALAAAAAFGVDTSAVPSSFDPTQGMRIQAPVFETGVGFRAAF